MRRTEPTKRPQFDPMTNTHMWTMWRTKVTGKITDETKSMAPTDYTNFPFGKAIMEAPLMRYIRLQPDSLKRTEQLQVYNGPNTSQEHLSPDQFVFFGLPRVVLPEPENKNGHVTSSGNKVLENNTVTSSGNKVLENNKITSSEEKVLENNTEEQIRVDLHAIHHRPAVTYLEPSL